MPSILISILIFSGVLTGNTGFLFANEPPTPIEISLDQAMGLVKKNNPDIRLQEIAVEKAAQEVKLATRAFIPDLDVDYIASSGVGGFGLILTAAKLLK